MANKKPTLKLCPLVHKVIPTLADREQITIALAGCGGNGSQMLTKLARLDYALKELGRRGLMVYAFDPDKVSRANVGRQLFSPSDVGQHKCAVLINRINAYYGLDWQAAAAKYEGRLPDPFGLGGYTNPDILISCVDTARARRQFHEQMSSTKHGLMAPYYWLDLGNKKSEGQVILGQPVNSISQFNASLVDFQGGIHEARRKAKPAGQICARLPVVTEIFPELLNPKLKEDDAPSCSLVDALSKQSLFTNDACVQWAAEILDGLLRIREILYHGVFLNLTTGKVNPLPVPAWKSEERAKVA